MSGGWHIDFPTSLGTTYLLMISPTYKEGSFFYYNNQKIEEEKYEQNKLIIFNGKSHQLSCNNKSIILSSNLFFKIIDGLPPTIS